ncbi:hypothetical protein Bca4012_086960 [Brassica carinata]
MLRSLCMVCLVESSNISIPVRKTWSVQKDNAERGHADHSIHHWLFWESDKRMAIITACRFHVSLALPLPQVTVSP